MALPLPPGFEEAAPAPTPLAMPPGFEENTPAGNVARGAWDAVKQLPSGIVRGLGKVGEQATNFALQSVLNNPVNYFQTSKKDQDLLQRVIGYTVEGLSPKKAIEPYLPKPETAAGRYANSAGEMIGESLPMMGSMYAMAPAIARQAAAAPAQTILGRVVQGGAQQFVNSPVRTVAMDAAGAGAAGLARQRAEDAGYGAIGQTVAAVGGGLVPGVLGAYSSALRGATAAPIGNPTAQSTARARQVAADADSAAFNEHQVRPFGPAFNQGPIASIGKQVTETPLVGSSLRNNLDETYQDMRNASDRLAARISPDATPETAGIAAQQGLERFKNAGLADLPQTTVTNLGLPATRMGPPHTVMSQGALNAANQAAPIRAGISANTAQTSRGVTVPNARPQSQMLTARTGAEHLTDDQLATLVRAPSADTSFGARAEGLYERAWRMVPQMLRSDGTTNSNRLAAVNTRNALGSIEGNIASQIVSQGAIRGDLAERLASPSAHFGLADLRAIRTEVGRSIGNYSPMAQNTLDRSQLKHLYGALSRDIEVGLETLANRAAIRTTANGPNNVSVQTAREAASALHAMRTADRYFRQGMERMDRFAGVVNAQSPEGAAKRLVSAALDGTKGNIRMFRSAMAGLQPEERAQFGAMVVREMGAPIPSARGIVQETGFSANSFVTNFQKMSPEARNLVFAPEHRQSLEELFRVANRISNVEALANTSRSGTNTMNVTGMVGSAASILHGDFVTPLAIGGSALASSVLMSSPRYTQWLTSYIRLRANVRDGSDRAVAPLLRHLGALERGARLHPELWPVYYAVSQEIQDKKAQR